MYDRRVGVLVDRGFCYFCWLSMGNACVSMYLPCLEGFLEAVELLGS